MLSTYSHRVTAEESDSDSDEDLDGGVRHDLMMTDEKVRKYYKHSGENSYASFIPCPFCVFKDR